MADGATAVQEPQTATATAEPSVPVAEAQPSIQLGWPQPDMSWAQGEPAQLSQPDTAPESQPDQSQEPAASVESSPNNPLPAQPGSQPLAAQPEGDQKPAAGGSTVHISSMGMDLDLSDPEAVQNMLVRLDGHNKTLMSSRDKLAAQIEKAPDQSQPTPQPQVLHPNKTPATAPPVNLSALETKLGLEAGELSGGLAPVFEGVAQKARDEVVDQLAPYLVLPEDREGLGYAAQIAKRDAEMAQVRSKIGIFASDLPSEAVESKYQAVVAEMKSAGHSQIDVDRAMGWAIQFVRDDIARSNGSANGNGQQVSEPGVANAGSGDIPRGTDGRFVARGGGAPQALPNGGSVASGGSAIPNNGVRREGEMTAREAWLQGTTR